MAKFPEYEIGNFRITKFSVDETWSMILTSRRDTSDGVIPEEAVEAKLTFNNAVAYSIIRDITDRLKNLGIRLVQKFDANFNANKLAITHLRGDGYSIEFTINTEVAGITSRIKIGLKRDLLESLRAEIDKTLT